MIYVKLSHYLATFRFPPLVGPLTTEYTFLTLTCRVLTHEPYFVWTGPYLNHISEFVSNKTIITMSVPADNIEELANSAVLPKPCLKALRGSQRNDLLHVSEGAPMSSEKRWVTSIYFIRTSVANVQKLNAFVRTWSPAPQLAATSRRALELRITTAADSSPWHMDDGDTATQDQLWSRWCIGGKVIASSLATPLDAREVARAPTIMTRCFSDILLSCDHTANLDWSRDGLQGHCLRLFLP